MLEFLSCKYFDKAGWQLSPSCRTFLPVSRFLGGTVCGGVPSGVGVGGFHRCSREQQAELHYLWETPLSLSLPVRLQLFIRTDFPQKRRLSLRWVCSSRREKSEASVNQKKWFFTSVAFVASQSLCCYVLTSLLISVFVWGGGHCQTQEEEEEEEEECIK